jgi:hypothetical protein
MSLIGGWLVARFGDQKANLKGLDSMALLDIQLFDRVRVILPDLGVDADFYVISYGHDYLGQRTVLGLGQV